MDYDPIRLEVFKNLLSGIAEEVGVTLCRTAFSPNIKERKDFSCALFDGQGRMIAQAEHIPVHLGGMPPGSMPLSTEVFQEGIRIPPIKIMVDGRVHHDLLQLILANVRTPREREGDLTAQIAANRTGERRLREVIGKYGLPEVLRYSAELQRYSERMTRHVIAAIPDGEYQFEDYMDDDGITSVPVKIRVTVRVHGQDIEVDFT